MPARGCRKQRFLMRPPNQAGNGRMQRPMAAPPLARPTAAHCMHVNVCEMSALSLSANESEYGWARVGNSPTAVASAHGR
eukprot:4354241-Pyramimonas_sp.AAC.1